MSTTPGSWTRLHGLGTLILIVAALYFLFVEHAEHVLPYLPYLILLLCPLMHVFMHKSHGGHEQEGGHRQHESDEANRRGLEEGREQSKRPENHQ